MGSNAANKAASAQEYAAQLAANTSMGEFGTITAQEQPFMGAGYGALSSLNQGLGMGPNTSGSYYGSLLQPFTADNFRQLSPAYNFQAQQGRQGVLNGDAPGVGALSGAAQKDLMGYNQGFAGTSFANAFNMYNTQQGNIYSRLAGIAQLGQNAAANTGMQGANLAGQAAQAYTNYGTAAAGGAIGSANAWSGALNGLGTAALMAGNRQPYQTPAQEYQGSGGYVGPTSGGLVDPNGYYAPWS
jgi:hypothetical protein